MGCPLKINRVVKLQAYRKIGGSYTDRYMSTTTREQMIECGLGINLSRLRGPAIATY
jgi:hypothetical protein